MLESWKSRGGKRWPRGQRFSLTPAGRAAAEAYDDAVRHARAQGRDTLEAAQRAWAEPLALQPADGVVLAELRPGRKGVQELARGLEDCGVALAEVRSAVDRLTDAGLAEPATSASQQPAL
ncbi:hypothetical protein [Anaeromyxobacter paludicola]|uniref:MarR family transcriptional regulator n=1 Tax=Anaeromyxobacter paludicola TaxID=2918171 RepID=A0ABM7XFB9_9BACT|nr:hypothetical protein [Anaeromyxobacter paludicola]BDG10565.1 hypothetical protein AMPC_36780 [Anaeromyxobacter paludicola]